VLTLFLVAAMNPTATTAQEPKKDEWTHRVTIQFAEKRFTPLKNVKAKTRVQEKTGETIWEFQAALNRTTFTKGSLIIVEEGEGKGDVWVVTRVGGNDRYCIAEKKPPEPEKKD
jgi:frataxin-like iron-binding protein CyaY